MGGHGAWEMNQKQLPLVILFSLFFSSSFLQTRRVHAHTQDPHRAKMHRLGATKMSKTCIFRQSTARDCTHTDAGGLSRKSAFLPSCFAETLKRVATHAMLPRFRSRRVCDASIADWHSGCGNSTGKARTFSARTLSFHSIILIKLPLELAALAGSNHQIGRTTTIYYYVGG